MKFSLNPCLLSIFNYNAISMIQRNLKFSFKREAFANL